MGGTTPDGGIGVLLSIFSPDKNCSAWVTATVEFSCPASGCGTPAITARVLNKSTSPFDLLRAEGSEQGWLQYNDGQVYSIGQMLNDQGKAALNTPPVAARYRAAQTAAFAGVANPAAARVSLRCNQALNACTFSVSAVPPAVFALTASW